MLRGNSAEFAFKGLRFEVRYGTRLLRFAGKYRDCKKHAFFPKNALAAHFGEGERRKDTCICAMYGNVWQCGGVNTNTSRQIVREKHTVNPHAARWNRKSIEGVLILINYEC